jgi:ABC-type sugar transport system ATPase subunit
VADVRFTAVDKVFGDGTHAVHALDLHIDHGQLLVLVGPSGCGKTTALRMVAGLDDPTAGTITIGGAVVNQRDPAERDIAMVFQSYALYPHMTVADNIGFPLRLRRLRREERRAKVTSVARMLGLETYLDRKPAELSGGQRQRVAMGRALVREPSVFLLDEPLSNLDAKLRGQMRAEISSVQRQLDVTAIYVTHDQVEAMTLGDKVAVMRRGRLQQVGAPQDIYDRPANLFTASFVGSPPMNLFEAGLHRRDDELVAAWAGRELVIDDEERHAHPELERHVGEQLVVGVRPERIGEAAGLPAGRRISGRVERHEALGSDSLVHLSLDGSRPLTRSVAALAHDVEDAVQDEELDHSARLELIARFDPRSRVEDGRQVELEVAPGSLRFFDRTAGTAIA